MYSLLSWMTVCASFEHLWEEVSDCPFVSQVLVLNCLTVKQALVIHMWLSTVYVSQALVLKSLTVNQALVSQPYVTVCVIQALVRSCLTDHVWLSLTDCSYMSIKAIKNCDCLCSPLTTKLWNVFLPKFYE